MGGELYVTSTGTVRARYGDASSKRGLNGYVSMFPTPTAPDGGGTGGGTGRSGKRINEPASLHGMASRGLWPTPRAHETIDLPKGTRPGNGADNLATAVVRRTMPTPSANDYKGSSKPGQRRGQLTDPAMGVIPAAGRLNPDWVELIMGWPLGSTQLEPMACSAWGAWPAGWERDVPRITSESHRRADRLRMLGNGQVPASAAAAWLLLTEDMA